MTPLPPPIARKTYSYRTDNGSTLQADVLRGNASEIRPCIMWIHGGGLIFGSRTISPRPFLARTLVERGFVVVSIDHRLAPETKLESIVEDVFHAWQWIHESGPGLFGADPTRVCAAGASAGAYLSLMAGYLFSPRPRAIASFWGFGDITAPWEAEPSAHYRTAALVERSDALESLALTPIPTTNGEDRSLYYLYCRQQGQWLSEVTGHSLPQDAAWFSKFCPLRNVDAAFPPTVLVHGRDDSDVPATESDELAAGLQDARVVHEYYPLPGIGHGFAGASPEFVETVETSVVDFLFAQVAQ